MSDLRELYQELILDHNRNPRHCYCMENATLTAEGFNPLCGDQLSLYLKVDNDRIIDASFTGKGCAISTASASLMTDLLIGKTLEETHQLFNEFHHMMTANEQVQTANLGKLTVLAGVKAFPSRVKCATLAWHTLDSAIVNKRDIVSTE